MIEARPVVIFLHYWGRGRRKSWPPVSKRLSTSSARPEPRTQWRTSDYRVLRRSAEDKHAKSTYSDGRNDRTVRSFGTCRWTCYSHAEKANGIRFAGRRESGSTISPLTRRSLSDFCAFSGRPDVCNRSSHEQSGRDGFRHAGAEGVEYVPELKKFYTSNAATTPSVWWT